MVVRTLEEEFNIYREVDGDSLPLRSHDRCNGRQSNGREGKKVTPSRCSGSHRVTRTSHSNSKSYQIALSRSSESLQVIPSCSKSLRAKGHVTKMDDVSKTC